MVTGELGRISALATDGGVLPTTTVLEPAAGPSTVPSFGVAKQRTASPLSNQVPFRVLVVGLIGAPATVQE